MTHPVRGPTKVTDVAAKSGGTGSGPPLPRPGAVPCGAGALDCFSVWPPPDGERVPEWPTATPLPGGLWPICSTEGATCGTTAIAAMTAAAVAADAASLRYLRCRARRLISSKVPGGGGSGSIFSCSHASRPSLRSSIGFSEGGSQPRPRVEKIGLDGPLRTPEQRGDLADPEARVVMEQEHAAHARRQVLDEGAHVHVLRGVRHGSALGGGDRAQGASFPFRPSPVVSYQVGCDHVKVALRVVERGPPGEQPGERFVRDLVRGLVIVDKPPYPSGQPGVGAAEQLFSGRPVGPAEPGHRHPPAGCRRGTGVARGLRFPRAPWGTQVPRGHSHGIAAQPGQRPCLGSPDIVNEIFQRSTTHSAG